MSYENFNELLHRIFEKNGLSHLLSEENSRDFYNLAEILKETNKSLNLTAVCDDEGIILKHFADSLIGENLIEKGAYVIDVGCGGGFPTFPLAIVRRDLHIVALDSTEKKINFVKSTAKTLNLSNIEAISGRAEELGRGEMREKFDVATARAVAALPILTELCMPFVKKGGTFIAMKALKAGEEIENTLKINLFEKLGGEKAPMVKEMTLESVSGSTNDHIDSTNGNTYSANSASQATSSRVDGTDGDEIRAKGAETVVTFAPPHANGASPSPTHADSANSTSHATSPRVDGTDGDTKGTISHAHNAEVLTRTVISVRKIEHTPKNYPRNYSQIAKSAKKLK